MIVKTLLPAVLTGLLWITVTAASAQSGLKLNVHEYELDNGLKVLVKPDARAPVVVVQVWYKVGSADEHSGITGVSHVLEHMMFKGTERYPAGEFSRIIAANGGEENAFTSRDYTAYYEMLEKSRLDIALELEADRMRNLALSKAAFLKEIEVVKEERRLRTDDNPSALTYEQLNATAFNHGPYHQPIIGWMSDLEHLTIADVRRWYDSWYAPNNATLVVAGDVEPDAVRKLAEGYFGGIPSKQLPDRKPRPEAPQRGERRAIVKAPAELPYLMQAYKAPALLMSENEWEPYALAVAAGVLDAGRSSRLSQRLVREQQVAASAGAGYDLYSRYDDLFLLDSTPARGRSVAEVERALAEEIEKLRTELVTQAELDRVKAQVVAAEVYAQDSVMTQATALGALETVGVGWEAIEEYVERIRAVTPEQVRAVARKYLIDDKRTTAVLEPVAIRPAAKRAAAPTAVKAAQ
ncbi:MAG: M16 family metallopeptidase [Gammaproteobacteria bacterium]